MLCSLPALWTNAAPVDPFVTVANGRSIWSQERWQQVSERLQTEGSDIAEQLAEMGLVL